MYKVKELSNETIEIINNSINLFHQAAAACPWEAPDIEVRPYKEGDSKTEVVMDILDCIDRAKRVIKKFGIEGELYAVASPMIIVPVPGEKSAIEMYFVQRGDTLTVVPIDEFTAKELMFEISEQKEG